MVSYLLKIFALLLFSFFILFNFYFVFPNHNENFDGYLWYVIIISIIYAVYKYFQLEVSKEKAIISFKTIISFFVLNLFILSFYFFSLSWNSISFWFELFFKVIFFSIFPVLIFLISTSFGKKILSKLPNKEYFWEWVFWMLELVIWFISFVSLIVIFGLVNLYNLYIVFAILIWFLVYSYKEFLDLIKSIFNQTFTFDIKEWSYLRLISTEFFTVFSFIVLSVWLISIIRPFPIGWDDLWVYMNYPHLMAEAWSLLSLWAMYTWQTFTGIWYMFGTPVSAFYLNISWLFLSFIVLVTVLSNLIKSIYPSKKSFFNLPVILSSIFISIPMVWFQSTKDMKVDEWLFFITVISLFFLYKYFLLIRENKNPWFIYLFLIWIIVWFAFSIKFTALLLLVSIIALLSFARLWVLGFIWYLSLFFWIFTMWNLWKMMNVVINPNSIAWFETTFWSITIITWIILLIYSFLKNKVIWKSYIKEVSLLLLWFFIILTPWFAKNVNEAFPNISVSTILWWKSWDFVPDYKKIYSDEELQKITTLKNTQRKKENAITTNEDLLRYFWYENGILDFVYMPWNLSMQKNQTWEYTNIWFLFLAFLPLIFIFLPYRKKYYALFFVFISFVQLLSYFQTNLKVLDNSNFSSVSTWSLVWVLSNNNYVFKDSRKNDDIYDINVSNYINDDLIKTWITKEYIDKKTNEYIQSIANQESLDEINKSKIKTQEAFDIIFDKKSKKLLENYDSYFTEVYNTEFNALKNEVVKSFYNDLKDKVKWVNTSSWFTMISSSLNESDLTYVKKLNSIYSYTSLFAVWDIVTLNEILTENNAKKEEIEIVNKIWNENRSLNWKIVDFFAKINLPLGYLFIFAGFFIPTIYLLFTLKEWKLNYIFKLNLVFASVYTFLWLISAFWIVWYGITMYFSFLLMIWLGAFFITNYKETDEENIYLFKLLGAVAFMSVVVLYFINSLIPYTFNNLKNASYEEFKTWQLTQAASIFAYHSDYKKILFTLNIDENKRKEFLEENISKDILKAVDKIEKKDINEIFDILITLKNSKDFKISADRSLENLYKNIQNPSDKYKNKEKIYRIWTFLKYNISENNNRLLEDSLLFNFSDYIFWENNSITIDRFKTLWLKYLLVDLNAATIDQSETHDLTTRYENLLKTFNSSSLELVETDSICLKVALDRYKTTKKIDEYMILAGVNYDSYDEKWEKIYRQQKKLSCATFINNLLEANAINENDFSYLLPYKKYFETNPRSVEKIDSMIWMSYKILFKIK